MQPIGPGGTVVEAALLELKQVIIGKDPFNIEKLWKKMYQHLNYIGTAGAAVTAVSGVEIALCDTVGKALGAPIYNLLGGRCSDRIRLYTHPDHARDGSPQEIARAC